MESKLKVCNDRIMVMIVVSKRRKRKIKTRQLTDVLTIACKSIAKKYIKNWPTHNILPHLKSLL